MEKKPISKALKTFYGIGDFGFSMMTQVELYFFVFFLTNVAKFSLPMVALIGSITSIVDAILSPFYGGIIAGTKAMRWGRLRSWILIGPPLVVVLYMFQYTNIGTELTAAAIVCAGFILSHIVWNIGWVANVSLIPMLASTPQERGMLASRRGTWTAFASVIFSYIGAPLAAAIGEATGSVTMGYTLLAGIMAAVMMLGYLVIFKLTAGYEPTGKEAEMASSGAQRVTFSAMGKSLVQNPPLIGLLIADFFRYITSFIMTAAAAYYFTYVAQNMKLFPTYLLIGGIAQVAGAYAAGLLVKKMSNRQVSILGLFGLAAAFFATRAVGMNVTMFFVAVCFVRIFLGLLSASMVALYSDASVFGEWKTGENTAAFNMGLMNLSLKTAIISRGTIIPFVLASAGFVAGTDPATATVALKTAVLNVFLLIPGFAALLSAVLLTLLYRLTSERLDQYQKEINERKANAAKA